MVTACKGPAGKEELYPGISTYDVEVNCFVLFFFPQHGVS
jgi:hypothetical protein